MGPRPERRQEVVPQVPELPPAEGDVQPGLSATGVARSFCRTCTNGCAVLVEVSGSGRAVRLTGDAGNPVYRGYTCPKGRAQPELAASTERCLPPCGANRTAAFPP
jgi:anaerobic selenocysteine-containing dehydrogenase